MNSNIPLIAPFWSDVDITRFGNIFYRETSNATFLQRARDQLQELFPSSGDFTPTTLFIATWDRVAQLGGGPQVHICIHDKFLLVTITTHCYSNKTARRPRGTDIMGHYTNSAMEDCFIKLRTHQLQVPYEYKYLYKTVATVRDAGLSKLLS